MMRLCCFLVAATGVFAQQNPAAKLDPILGAMQDAKASRVAISQQLTDAILSLAPRDRLPSRPTVAAFADEMAGSLIGKNLGDGGVLVLRRAITDVLNPAGATIAKASSLRKELGSLGIDAEKAHAISSRYVKIGEEVRGPDDIPVQPQPRQAVPQK